MRFLRNLVHREEQETPKPKASDLTDQEYIDLAQRNLDLAWDTLNSGTWRLERRTVDGDTVHSRHLPDGKKVFKLTGTVRMPAEVLWRELFLRIEHVPKWNPTLVECRKLYPIDEKTDVNYQVTAEAAGGLISKRDFVNLRRSGVKGDCLVASGATIEHSVMPPQSTYVRGENGPGIWVMRPLETTSCEFQWLLNTNLHGWLPQMLVDSALTSAMFDYIGHIRKYSDELRAKGDI